MDEPASDLGPLSRDGLMGPPAPLRDEGAETACEPGRPLAVRLIVCFIMMGIAETPHRIPGPAASNAFGFDRPGSQPGPPAGGGACFVTLAPFAHPEPCAPSARTDLPRGEPRVSGGA